jgi:hypothetical protein
MTTLTRHDSSPADAVAVASEAFVFGYPLVLMGRMRGRLTAAGFVHEPAPRRGEPPVRQTLASSAWLDLDAEPVVLSVSDCHGRYYALSLIDMWTNVFASIGPRTSGAGARTYAIGGPHFDGGALPAGVLPVTAPTNVVHVAGQTQIAGAAGRHPPPPLEDAYRLDPLSRWRCSRRDPPPGAASPLPAPTRNPAQQVDGLTARTFFAEMAALLEGNPPRLADRPIVERMRRSGVLPANHRQPAAADPALEALLERGRREGLARLRAASAALRETLIGTWRMRHAPGPYGTDYLRRAVVARAGSFGTSMADEMEAVTAEDAEGRPLSGAHRYELRFAADGSPPVRGFWALVSDRSSIGDSDGLAMGTDGSLTISIQAEPPPARAQRTNWLPTPGGGFALALRLFWPTGDVLEQRWAPPAVTRIS